MTALRILFLGAGKLAQPVFEGLVASRHRVCGLVTQPDRFAPGKKLHLNPLKEIAAAHGIPVLQPEKIKTPEAIAALRELAPDLSVVAAYGQMLSQTVLDLPRLGTINVHASLLPKYRGATPIHAAVRSGDAEAGVTIIRLVMQLDAGPMLGEVRTPIGALETTGELEQRLAELSVPLTLNVVEQLADGTAHFVEQDHTQATHVGKLTKIDGLIDWSLPAVEVERHLRAMQPWPAPVTLLHQPGKPPLRLQVLRGDVVESQSAVAPGTVISVTATTIDVRCGEGALRILQVHPEAKRVMPTADFLRGRPVVPGDRFEKPA